jgi:ParB family transcriptional regulator, chromosome partitioning protein
MRSFAISPRTVRSVFVSRLAAIQALIAITHALTSHLFYLPSDRVTCLDIRAHELSLGDFAEGIDDTAAAKALGERHEAWGAELPRDASELWEFIAALDPARRLSLLAHCVSLTVSAVR